MEREISGGAMLGIVLLALAAVIGLGFGVFSIAKSIANEGTVNVQDSLATVSSQVFLDYDQKIVTGTQAIAGLKAFEGKPYAVLISTRALANGRDIAPKSDRPNGAYVVAAGATTGTDGDGNPIITGADTLFINYNAIIADETGGADAADIAGENVVAGDAHATIGMSNGSYIIPNGLAASAGNIIFDNATAGLFKSGNAEFIPTSSKFQANLLKDSSGNILGIALKQI